MNFEFKLENEILLMDKYRITSNDLIFVRAVLMYIEERNDKPLSLFLKYLSNMNIKLLDFVGSLRDKGVILKSYKLPEPGEKFVPNKLPFNKLFMKDIYKASFSMGKELFDVYPQFGIINGSSVPLRAVAKKFDSLEDAFRVYGKQIHWNEEAHREVLRLVEWAKEHGAINCSLATFIINNGWIDLQALRDGEAKGVICNNMEVL